jgi:hypothetical protein
MFSKINAEIAVNKIELDVEKAEQAVGKAIEAMRLHPNDLCEHTINTVVKKWGILSFITDEGYWLVIENNDSDDRDEDTHCLRYPRLSIKLALAHGVIPVNLQTQLEDAQKALDEVKAEAVEADRMPKAQRKLLEVIDQLGIDNVRELVGNYDTRLSKD